MTKERTEMYCHDCDEDFTAELDMDVNGNHEIECPHCGHIHYRVVQDGKVTGQRYRSSMGTVVANTWGGTSSTSGSNAYISSAWGNSTSVSYAVSSGST